MRDQLRKLGVLSIFCAAVAGVWTLGAVKAELDRPVQMYPAMTVDPTLVRVGSASDAGCEGGVDDRTGARWSFYAG